MMSWESDQLIVLGERESRFHGEGADVIRSQPRDQGADVMRKVALVSPS